MKMFHKMLVDQSPAGEREVAPVPPSDPQHGVIRRSPPITADRSITLVTRVESLQ